MHQSILHRPNSGLLSQRDLLFQTPHHIYAPFNPNSIVGDVAMPSSDYNPLVSPSYQGAVSLNSPGMLEEKHLNSHSDVKHLN